MPKDKSKVKSREPTYGRSVYRGSSVKTTTESLVGETYQDHAPVPQPPVPSQPIPTESLPGPPESQLEPESAREVESLSAGPTPYYLAKSKEVSQWQTLRQDLLASFFDGNAPVPDFDCVECGAVNPSPLLRCLDCGPFYQGCHDCVITAHRHRPYHSLEQWKEHVFVPATWLATVSDPTHKCSAGHVDEVVELVTSQGQVKPILVSFCHCTPRPVLMAKCRLWPDNPKSPQTAYPTSLLGLAEALMLETNASLSGFLSSFRWRNELSDYQYQVLKRIAQKESFYEFRHIQHQLRTLATLEPELDDGSTCFLCPKPGEKRPMFVSMDGNFGLVRKASSGKSLEPSRHQKLFLAEAAVVESLERYADDSKINDGECDQFQAGDKLRSKVKSAKLDVKGVFGAVCRHEMPLLFLNLLHGERYAYPVTILEKLLETHHADQLMVMYDISCNLHKYMQKHAPQLLEKMNLAIPVFHSYGHKATCQIEYNPRRLKYFGLTDGEAMERLWAYLRRFAAITKEMTPSHRIDLLTDAILHFAFRKKHTVVSFLVLKYKEAKNLETFCKTQLESALKENNLEVTEEIFNQWADIEKQEMIQDKQSLKSSDRPSSWTEQYVHDIVQLTTIQTLLASNENTVNNCEEKIKTLKEKLKKIERAHAIPSTWSLESEQFQQAICSLEDRQKQNALKKLQGHVRERNFLLQLKKKYPAGQGIAIRLERQLKRTSKTIRTSIGQYNARRYFSVCSHMPDVLDENECFSLSADVYSRIETQVADGLAVPPRVRKSILDIWFREKRCKEELVMIEAEMKCLYQSLAHQHKTLMSFALQCSCAGIKATFLAKALKNEQQFILAKHAFSEFIGPPTQALQQTVGNIVDIENDIMEHEDFEGWAMADYEESDERDDEDQDSDGDQPMEDSDTEERMDND